MEISTNIIERYKKICALAERGEGNEAENAKTMKERLEKKHPGIQLHAFPPKHTQNDRIFQDFRATPDPSVWETFTEKAGDFFSKVKDFTYNAIGIQAAKNLVKEGKFTVRETTRGMHFSYRMDHELVDEVYGLTEEEKFAFLEEAAQIFADELSKHIYDIENDYFED